MKLICQFALIVLSIITTFCDARAQKHHHSLAITDSLFDRDALSRELPVVRCKMINVTPEELQGAAANFILPNLLSTVSASYIVDIPADGTFSFTLPYALPYQQVWLQLGPFAYTCLYIQDGLEITFDFELLKKKPVHLIGEGITFSGPDAALCEQMNAYFLLDKSENDTFFGAISKLSVSAASFATELEVLVSRQREKNRLFYQTYGDTFRFLIDNETDVLLLFKELEKLRHDKVTVNHIEDILLPINDVSVASCAYLRELNYYSNHQLQDSMKPLFDYNARAQTFDAFFPSSYADLLKLQLRDGDVLKQLEVNRQIIPTMQQRWARKILQDEIPILEEKEKKIKALLATNTAVDTLTSLGEKKYDLAFGAQLYTNTSPNGAALVQAIRQHLPNTLIVLDFWATWCKPCLENMPYGKKLHEAAFEASFPFAFVYLCTDAISTEEGWVNKVLDLEQPGKHVYVQDRIIKELFTLFGKSGFPSYVVIKPNGDLDTKASEWYNMKDMNLEWLRAIASP